MQEVTQELLQKLFEYRDGNLFWKQLCTNKTKQRIGTLAGYIHPKGYRIVSVYGYQHKAHRLVFLYHHGYMPEFIDHINNKKDDNRIENLRPATKADNCRNTGLAKNNTSGIKGVSKAPRLETWRARISVKGKFLQVGGFKNKEAATEFIQKWRTELHGQFANHGTQRV